MNIYIQRSDFSEALVRDHVKLAEAIEIFSTYNWHQEMEYWEELEARGEEVCPVNYGIINTKNKTFLDISFYGNNDYEIYYTYKSYLKFLGITLPFKITKSNSMAIEQKKDIFTLIELFYQDAQSDIVKRFR